MRDDGIVLYEIQPRVGFGPALRPPVEHHKGIDALTVVRKAGYKPSMESIALEFTVKQLNDGARIGDALDRIDEVESRPAYCQQIMHALPQRMSDTHRRSCIRVFARNDRFEKIGDMPAHLRISQTSQSYRDTDAFPGAQRFTDRR